MRDIISDMSSFIVAISIIGIFISFACAIIRKIKKKNLKPVVISFCCCIAAFVIFSVIGSTAWRGTERGKESMAQARLEKEEKEREKSLEKEKEEERKRIEEERKEKEQKEQAKLAKNEASEKKEQEKSEKKEKKKIKKSKAKKDKEKNGQEKYGDIKDFSYKISENRILIEEYNGKSDILEIKPSYSVEEKEYITDLSEFQVGIGNSKVKTLILGEGITDINDAAFNSCDVESVYFPKTISVVYDKTLNYLHPADEGKIKIYYAGTEEEWNNIFAEYERKTVKEAWNSGETPEEKGSAAGTALADKLNDWMSNGYDSSEFEYFFSATPDDLK